MATLRTKTINGHKARIKELKNIIKELRQERPKTTFTRRLEIDDVISAHNLKIKQINCRLAALGYFKTNNTSLKASQVSTAILQQIDLVGHNPLTTY